MNDASDIPADARLPRESVSPDHALRAGNEKRVLIFAPTGNDANLTATFLQRAGLNAAVCPDMRALAEQIHQGCGVLVLAEETLEQEATVTLTDALAAQPSWSDIPVVIVTSGGELSEIRTQRLKAFGREINLTILSRPFRPTVLIRTLEVSLRARQRQYQVRDLLADLKSNEARVRRILEQNAVGIAELDLQGRFILVNDQFCATVRRSRETLIRSQIREITHPEDVARAQARREAVINGSALTSILEKRYSLPDGGYVWVQDHLSGIRDLNGVLCGITIASADITDRKRAEQAAELARDEAVAASRAKDDFLAALSHELRTPLNPVLLLASEGANNPGYPQAARADFEAITRNVTLEARLFEDLLDLTRITRGKLNLDLKPLDFHESLRDALGTVEDDLRQRHIYLHRDFTGESLLVAGDSVRLQQVVWNVLKNAVKFTPPGGTITVATRRRGSNRGTVTIIDTGIGMTPDELSRIFDTFAQGDHASGQGAHRFGGLGLGLAISKTLVELHGGSIVAASPGRDQGAQFTIELPLLAASADIRTARPSRPPASTPFEVSGVRTRVLVVEDHEPTRTALTRLLERRKFEVFSAASCAEAFTVGRRESLDLLLSDVGLPDGTGYDLMREFRITHGLRGIALTGYGKDRDIEQSRDAGFAAHLTKPVDVRSLDKVLRELNALPA